MSLVEVNHFHAIWWERKGDEMYQFDALRIHIALVFTGKSGFEARRVHVKQIGAIREERLL